MKKLYSSYLLVLGFGVSLLMLACGTDTPVPSGLERTSGGKTEVVKEDSRPVSVQNMEQAQGLPLLAKVEGIRYKLNLIFGGTPRFKGVITQTGNMDRIRLEQEDEQMVFDGKDVHVATTGMLDTKSARFNALTWPYFFSLSNKLNDPGTVLEELKDQTVEGQTYRRAKLTFSAGTGDAPDDWYILYFDDQDQLAAAAYIVTFGGRSAEEALANAHAIRYLDYDEVDGVLFSRKWTFHDWSEEDGWTKQLGEAGVYDIELLSKIPAGAFVIPEGAIAAGAPL